MPAGLLSSSQTQRDAATWLKLRHFRRAAVTLATFFFLFYVLVLRVQLPGITNMVPDRDPVQHVTTKSDAALSSNLQRSAKPRAAFVVLVRDRQLGELLPSLRDIQWAFNDDPEHCYDYVFLSEAPFTQWFKDRMSDFLASRPCQPHASYGLISSRDWAVPASVDLDRAKHRWDAHMSSNIPYAKSTTYRQMCRYMSGPIFQHPLLDDLEYTWRLEPETKHLCTYRSHWKMENGKKVWVERDPFRYMKEKKKKYAWVMTMSEYRVTVMTLMAHINHWRAANPSLVPNRNTLSFVSDDGKGFNLCHFWSNFEIIDLSFARSEAYTSLFKKLDDTGGFFYERWGDAPVRSIAAGLLLNNDEIWNIDYAGYSHPPFSQCPRKLDPGQACACDSHMNIDYGFGYAACRARIDKINGIDSGAVIASLNAESGLQSPLKDGEEPYVVVPPRLMKGSIH